MKRSIALIALFTFTACNDKPVEKAAPAPKKATPADKAAAIGLTGLQKLALEDPKGSSDVDEEIRRFQKIVSKRPKKHDPWIFLGRAWVKKARETSNPGFYNNAKICADIAEKLEPGSALANNLHGLVLMNDHRFKEAKALMEKILAKDPDDIMAHGTLSDALLELGEFDEAVKHAQKMMDLKPALPSYARAGYIQWLTGDGAGARANLKKAIMAAGTSRDKETFAWILVEAAKVFWHEGDHDGAEPGLDKALEAFPNHPPALVWKARIELGRGNAKKALEMAKKSYAGSALAETAWVAIDAARAAGDEKTAADFEAKLVKLGEHGEARVLAAYYATENKETKRAIELAEKELKTRGDIHTQDAYAWALYRAERFDEALAAAEKATRHGTQDAALLYHLGAIQIAAGKKAKGKKNVEAALALNPKWHTKSAAEAKALLAGL